MQQSEITGSDFNAISNAFLVDVKDYAKSAAEAIGTLVSTSELKTFAGE